MIRMRKSSAGITCKYCGEAVIKSGLNKGDQRYKCKECGRTFYNRETGRVPRETKERAIEMYLNNCGIRKTAKFVKVSPTAVMNWIKTVSARVEKLPPEESEAEADIIEFDEIYTYCAKKNDEC